MDHRFEIGLIRVITCDAPDLGAHGRLLEAAYPFLSVESRCIPDQPEGIHSHEMELAAVPKIVDLAREAFASKDAILVSCAEDPGAPEVRAALPRTPAIGAGEAACAMALRYGRRVGVLGITDVAPKAYIRMLGEPLFDENGSRIADEDATQTAGHGCQIANIRPHGVHSTLDLQTPEGRTACIEGARLLRRLGSDVIALGCTGMATIGIARELEDATRLPVIDPVLAMGAFAAFEAAKKSSKRKPHRNWINDEELGESSTIGILSILLRNIRVHPREHKSSILPSREVDYRLTRALNSQYCFFAFPALLQMQNPQLANCSHFAYQRRGVQYSPFAQLSCI